ncbi:MAG: bifunctional phosphopantothenoylcysteine decarboxylase/phosphopantothenate--cysteine ligase CoaBC [Rhodoluna sp.]
MRIVIGITGGVAAYKSANLIRLFTESGHEVKVVATPNALKFIGSATLEALSHNKIATDLFEDVHAVKHIELAKWADVIVVAPATASFVARYASGLADDLLGNVLLATRSRVFIAPAMHTEMWEHEATVANIGTLSARGVVLIEPEAGRLTGGDSGKGRLAEPDLIFQTVIAGIPKQPLIGKKILITGGGTREAIDPVRFIGNRSSGKQAIAIAQTAESLGAHVTFIACNVEMQMPFENVIHVETAEQLRERVLHFVPEQDILIMAAAVADFGPAQIAREKIKKAQVGDNVNLQLSANVDILEEVTDRKSETNPSLFVVGFAAETSADAGELERYAFQKLQAKKCDILVANDVSGGAVFGSEENNALVVTSSGRVVPVVGSKTIVAQEIFDVILNQLDGSKR